MKKFLFLAFGLLILPTLALAHQPRITEGRLTIVPSPEISKAYYAELVGVPDVYVINATTDFDLYVNVLVPDIAGQNKDVSAVIVKVGDTGPLATLAGPSHTWTQFYEPFGADTYWKGPEYKSRATAGTYEITVSSPANDSKYSLAIGELEAFDRTEGLNALTTIPKLKKDFFGGSSIGFIASPFGWGMIAILYILAFIIGFIVKYFSRKFLQSKPITVSPPALSLSNGSNPSLTNKNIGTRDRLARLAFGLAMLLFAMLTTWNPILIFASGVVVFQAVFSWCFVYQAMGKNTCPAE